MRQKEEQYNECGGGSGTASHKERKENNWWKYAIFAVLASAIIIGTIFAII